MQCGFKKKKVWSNTKYCANYCNPGMIHQVSIKAKAFKIANTNTKSDTSVNYICWLECIFEGNHEKEKTPFNPLATGTGPIRFHTSHCLFSDTGVTVDTVKNSSSQTQLHESSRQRILLTSVEKWVISNSIFPGNICFMFFLLLLIQCFWGLIWIQYPSNLIFFLCLCFASQKATPPFPRQHPLFKNRTYEDSCGFTHTFTASHTHSHTSETCGTFTVQMNLSSNSVVKTHHLNKSFTEGNVSVLAFAKLASTMLKRYFWLLKYAVLQCSMIFWSLDMVQILPSI